MRITLLTLGTRGDTQPFISLAVRLKEAGHSVLLGARPDFTGLAAEYGIAFAPLGRPFKPFVQKNTNGIESGNFLKSAFAETRLRKAEFENTGEDAYRAAIGSDAIIYKYSFLAGYSIAEKLGIPCAAVMVYPITPTGDYPCFLVGSGKDHGRFINSLTWKLCEQLMIWPYQRPFDNTLRKKTLNLKQLPYFGPYKRQSRENLPVYYAHSPILLPKPSDWPERIHVTGAWPVLPPANWRPPADLTEFLERGPAPVYIGFGSMPSRAARTLAIVLKALEISGKRGVILSGWADIGEAGAFPDTVFCVKEAPYSWLFPKMAAVVHHGGAGTVTFGLLSGVPSIITPYTLDQPSWARHVYALGVGPKPIPFNAVTPELLAGAIKEATTNDTMKKRAREVSKLIGEEDGVKTTMNLFFEYYNMVKKK